MEYSTAIPSIDPPKISHYGAMHVNFTDDDLLFLDENNTSIPTNMLHMQDGDRYVIVCIHIYIYIYVYVFEYYYIFIFNKQLHS